MSNYPQNTAELKEFLCKKNLPYKISELGNTGLCRINTFVPAESFYLDRDLRVVQAKYYTDFGQFNLWWLERIESYSVNTENLSIEETKRKIKTMQAFTEGKKIEMKFPSGSSWEECDTPAWDWTALDYRIKPEPRILWENEYQEIANPDVIMRQVFWNELEARNFETPNGFKKIHSRKFLEVSFNDATRITELEKALKLCLHVIEKGIEVRMQDQWSILKEPLEEAKNAAKAVLRK